MAQYTYPVLIASTKLYNNPKIAEAWKAKQIYWIDRNLPREKCDYLYLFIRYIARPPVYNRAQSQ